MRLNFPELLCLIGAAVDFHFAMKLSKMKLPKRPPASRAHLSIEQRQKKMKLGVWLMIADGCLLLAGAILLLWLNKPA